MVTVGEEGTVVGAMYSPVESMVPAVAVQVTVWFELPLTVAEYCQFAPAPMFAGALPMLTVTGCCWILFDDEPPHATSERMPNTIVPHQT